MSAISSLSHGQPQAPFHSCTRCNFSTRHAILMERHSKRCGSTSVVSSTLSTLLPPSSILPAPSVCRNYKCGKCNFVSNKAKQFLYHQRQVHGENIAVYGCNECEYASRHKNKVVRHKRLVHKVESLPDDILALEDHSIINCSKDVSFSAYLESKDAADGQTTNNAEPVTKLQKENSSCLSEGDLLNQCTMLKQSAEMPLPGLGKSGEEGVIEKAECYRLTNFLGRWILPKVNTADGLYRCKFCRYSNPHKWKIASHMRTSHSRKTSYKCPQCTFVTERKIEWCTHKTLHSGKAIYSCNECAYQTTMKRNFERHQERHLVNGPRRCSLCSYSSTGEGAIQRHMAEYHPPSPGKVDAGSCEENQPEEDISEAAQNNTIPKTCNLTCVVSHSHSPIQMHSLMPMSSSSSCSSLNTSMCNSGVLASSSSLPSANFDDKRVKMIPMTSLNSHYSNAQSSSHIALSDTGHASGIICSETSESRWTCSLCPLGYKRAADLNRHMKRKHGVSLKDIKTRSSFSEKRNLNNCSLVNSSSATSSLLVLNNGTDINNAVLSNFYTLNNRTTLLITGDQPLNLSLKKKHENSCDNQEQFEVLDLSTKKCSSAFQPFEVTPHFRCDSCSYMTKKFDELEHHSLQHRYEKYSCLVCGKGFNTQFDMVKHVKEDHSSNLLPGALVNAADSFEKLEEKREGGVGGGLQNTSISMPSIKTDRVPTSNVLNNSKPDSVNTVDQTLLSLSSDVVSKSCQYVGKDLAEMDQHVKLHSGGKTLQCKFCLYKTVLRSDMKLHLLKAHQDKTKTAGSLHELHGLTYQPFDDNNDSSYEQHCLTDDSENDCVDYNMNVEMNDGKFMKETGDITPPTSGVTNKRMRICPFPGCKFFCETSSKMKSHLESHDNLKRFMCMHCGKRSSWLWDIRKHIRHHHPGVDMTIRELSEEEALSQPVVETNLLTDGQTKPEIYLKDDSRNTNFEEKSAEVYEVQNLKSLPAEASVDVEMLAEQYANEVAAMFYGSSGLNFTENNSSKALQTWNETIVPSGQSIVVKKFGRPSKSLLMNRFRPFKCSECGRRSNWRWDLNKHIRASHPSAHLIEMTELEAKATFHEVLHRDIRERRHLIQIESCGNAKLKLYKCDICGHKSNWKCDANEHMKTFHPSAQVIMLEEESKGSIADFNTQDTITLQQEISDKRENTIVGYRAMEKCSIPMAMTCVTVDSHKLKRFKCSSCPYRSNFRSDVGRHIRHKHDKGTSRIIVMNENEAAETLKEYMETWARKKFVSSPSKKRSGCDRHYIEQSLSIPYLMQKGADGDMPDEFMCSICKFKDQSQRRIIEHWQQKHCKDNNSSPLEISTLLSDSEVGRTLEVTENVLNAVNCSVVVDGNQYSAKNMSTKFSDISPKKKTECAGAGSLKNLACSMCPYQTSKTGLLNIHKTYHRPNGRNKYKCRYCPYYVCASRLLHQHMRLHLRENLGNRASCSSKHLESLEIASEDIGEDPTSLSCQESATRSLGRTTYCCLKCPYVSSNRNDYLYHRQFHRPRNTPAFKCDQCPYWVSQKRLLAQHTKVHGQEYQERHATSVGQQWTSEAAIPQERIMPNNQCGVETDCSDDLIEKIAQNGFSKEKNSEVTKSLPISSTRDNCCEQEKEFSFARQFHIGGKYECRDCPFVTLQKSEFEDHFNQHGISQKFSCDFCNFSVNNLNQLRQHKKLHVPMVIMKNKVAKTLNFDNSCESHFNEIKKTYCCDRCPYSNARRDHLMCHMKFHQIKSDLQCPHCTYSVSRVHLLNQHLKVHTSSFQATMPTNSIREPSCSIRQKRAKHQVDNLLLADNQTSFVVWMSQKLRICSDTSSVHSSPDIANIEAHKTDGENQLKSIFMYNLRLKSLVHSGIEEGSSFLESEQTSAAPSDQSIRCSTTDVL